MMANSFTIMRHPPELIAFMQSLAERNIPIINSAVFHAGFLVGGKYFDYRVVHARTTRPIARSSLGGRVSSRSAKPTASRRCTPACSSAKTGRAWWRWRSIRRIRIESSDNVEAVMNPMPPQFWASLKEEGLIADDYASL